MVLSKRVWIHLQFRKITLAALGKMDYSVKGPPGEKGRRLGTGRPVKRPGKLRIQDCGRQKQWEGGDGSKPGAGGRICRSGDRLYGVRLLLWLAGIWLELIGGDCYGDRECKRRSRVEKEKWSLCFWTCRVGDAYGTSTWRCPGSDWIHEFGDHRRVLAWKHNAWHSSAERWSLKLREDKAPIEDIRWEEEWAKRGALQTSNEMYSLQSGVKRSSHRGKRGPG